MKVTGYAAKGQGKPLEQIEYEAPKVGDRDVLVEISNCGLCHTDVHFMDNDFGMTKYPFVPGHEIVGTVTQVGKGVQNLSEGQRVGVGFQRGSCGICEWCIRGDSRVSPATCWKSLREDSSAHCRSSRTRRRGRCRAACRRKRPNASKKTEPDLLASLSAAER